MSGGFDPLVPREIDRWSEVPLDVDLTGGEVAVALEDAKILAPPTDPARWPAWREASPARVSVVLVAMAPSMPLSRRTAASSASACSSRSGAILTKTGGRAPEASRASSTPWISAERAPAP